jgi:hypothetical protein
MHDWQAQAGGHLVEVPLKYVELEFYSVVRSAYGEWAKLKPEIGLAHRLLYGPEAER